MDTLTRFMKELDQEITKIESSREATKKLPLSLFEEAFPQGRWDLRWMGKDFEFTIPFDKSQIPLINEVAKKAGYHMIRDFQCIWENDKSAGYFMYFSSEDTSSFFQVGMRSSREGSTCVLNPIGVKEVPIYEVVCSPEATQWENTK